MRRIRIKTTTATTVPGFQNANGQRVVQDTGFPSENFAGQRIYKMQCTRCRHDYGANGCDIHVRLCPNCQGGAEGARLRESGPRLFPDLTLL